MSSDDGEITKAPKQGVLPLKELADKYGTLPAKYDLDKNPIKYRQSDGSLSTEAHDKDYMELTLRSGKHSDLVRKLLRQRIESRAKEFPRWPAQTAGGVRALWLESRYWYDRERFQPHFDDEWRAYRSRYLHSLELDPCEPIYNNPEWEKFMLNPIRRFYMKPGDWLEKHVIQRFTNNRHHSSYYRVLFTRPFLFYVVLVALYYRLRYCEQTWELRRGQDLVFVKPTIYPGDPLWPWKETRTSHWHHYDQGFLSRGFYKDLNEYDDSSTTL